MVDSTKGIGPVQNLPSNNKTQDRRAAERTEDTGRRAPVDEVEISQEALDVSSASETAQFLREQLQQDESQTLSNGSNFDGLI
ncbi:MAG: hypothetical protein KDJ35_06895 [Alphaproteobacteria bacterium]|nr:hypothetical protein [Alphaproteobacteria bacterium]